MNFRFPSHEKLKDPQLINYVFENGKKFYQYPLLFLSTPLPAGNELSYETSFSHRSKPLNGSSKIAFSVPKRKFRKAVDRNRIKRMMREAYRLQKHRISSRSTQDEPQPYGVIVIYIGKEIPDYTTIFNAINRYIDQLQL